MAQENGNFSTNPPPFVTQNILARSVLDIPELVFVTLFPDPPKSET